jgi:hypothetical protein
MSGPKDERMYSSDMIVFDGSEVVTTFKGVKAQGVPCQLIIPNEELPVVVPWA